jgi:hypothetical protein
MPRPGWAELSRPLVRAPAPAFCSVEVCLYDALLTGDLGQDVGMATLDELEGTEWSDAQDGATFLVRRCHELRRKDVDDMTTEDLRLLIGQGIGLPWLVPIAVERLESDPLVAGDFHQGDLFASLLSVQESYWSTDTRSWLRLYEVAKLIATTGELAMTWLARTRGGA